MNVLLRRLSIRPETGKMPQPIQTCTSWAKLPPDVVIRDWLRKDRLKREKKKERPRADLPAHVPEDRTEERDDEEGGPIVIPIMERDGRDLN